MFWGCPTPAISQNKKEIEVLRSIVENSKYPISKTTIGQEYIDRLNLDLSYFNIWMPCKNELAKNSELLTEEEIKKLNGLIKKIKTHVLDFDSPMISADEEERTDLLTSITTPIFFRNENFAVYYSEQRYGGQMNLLKKENNTWVKHCSYSVWIE
jgi:hypothetical protein